MSFVHLNVHTEYSLLDSSARINELVAKAAGLGMEALAITDTGNMFGVVDFYKAAKARGIKPIIGCCVHENVNNLILLAENNLGYQNLIKLVSYGFKIDLEILRKYNQGLICLSGSAERAEVYKEIFGKDNFFLELQNHGDSQQEKVNQSLIERAKDLDLEVVATNDIHYLDKEDAAAHEVLLCIKNNKTIFESSQKKSEYYLKSAQEMFSAFQHLPKKALENTVNIAKRCNVEIEFGVHKLPRYDCPPGFTSSEYLNKLTFQGLEKRYGENLDQAVVSRANFELETILSMGFCDYFLVVWDFITFAKKQGIAVGPGRGTSASSIVAYALNITNIEPLKHNLMFERFLNPERISMPDIDIDFCVQRRQEVIDYVIKKYGQDHVAQIITFGTLGAKAAIRDVGRALGMSYGDVDKIAKKVPFQIGITLDKALEKEKTLRYEYENSPSAKKLIDMARRLEGLPRHASTHAAGVVVSDAPLTEYLPLYTNDGLTTTQFSMGILEELGLLKIDFLGLRTLTVIQHAMEDIYKRHGIKLHPETLDMEDKQVFDIISLGKTEGMFQLESPGMMKFMKELKPRNIEDLTAGISLFRPGPMDFIPKYVRSKNSGVAITYTHPSLEPILRDTYGCIVYQEQVMQIVRDLAGFSLGRADIIRRAISKMNNEMMQAEKQRFIHGFVNRGIENGELKIENEEDREAFNNSQFSIINSGFSATAELVWDEMADFAKYAFNKAHAVAYATVGYWTGWLKTHYPAEYMGALLSSVMGSQKNVSAYINECKRLGITISPPDVNHSFGHFAVIDDKQISFGMNAIKNLGRPTVEALVKSREKDGNFTSLTDFLNRLSDGEVNKRSLEAMIKAGAFTSLGGKRSQYMAVYENLLASAMGNRRQNLSGQISLFQIENGLASQLRIENGKLKIENCGVLNNSQFSILNSQFETNEDGLPQIAEYSNEKILSDEKEVLGIYVSQHSHSADKNQTLWLKIPKESQIMPEDLLDIMSKHKGTTPIVIHDEKTGKTLRIKSQYMVNAQNHSLINKLREILGSRYVVLK